MTTLTDLQQLLAEIDLAIAEEQAKAEQAITILRRIRDGIKKMYRELAPEIQDV